MLKNQLKKVINILEWIIFAVIAVVFFISFSPSLPFKNVPKTYMVETGSMIPVIKPGSVVVVLPKETEDIKVGDIVAFTSPEDTSMTIIHRISGILSEDPLIFETKGDNNNAVDSWKVYASTIVGKYIIAIPLLGILLAFIKQPLGFGLIVVIPAIFFLLLQIKNIKVGIDEEVNRRVKLAEEDTKKSKEAIRSLLLLISVTAMFFSVSYQKAVALFVDEVSISNISISVKDFVAPDVPDLLFPTDEDVLNTSGLVMDWSDESDYKDMHNPVYYVYQSSRNEDFSPLAYESGHLTESKIPAPNTPDGKYWWRVKACDAIDNCSDWSDEWAATIDNTAPVAKITNINDNDVFWNEMEIKGSITDSNPYSYTLKIKDESDNEVVKESDISKNASITDEILYTWDVSSIDEGAYTVQLEAEDVAGNYDSLNSKDKVVVEVRKHLNIAITSPQKDDSIHSGDNLTINWTVNKLSDSADTHSDIEVSLNGGTDFLDAGKVANNITNSYTYSWTIPEDESFKSDTVVIKVKVSDSKGFSGSSKSGIFKILEKAGVSE